MHCPPSMLPLASNNLPTATVSESPAYTSATSAAAGAENAAAATAGSA